MVHRKMKIHSLSIHHYADGGVVSRIHFFTQGPLIQREYLISQTAVK